MTFGNKIKKLRTDNNLTQDELAEKLFVTRTAISKWETNKGYPSIDSLKMISNLFGVSIDELISDDDIQNQRILEQKRARDFYWFAVTFLAVTVVATLVAYLTKIKYLNIISLVGIIGYVICAIFSKPKYKRIEAKKYILTYILSRVIVLLFVVGLITYSMATL